MKNKLETMGIIGTLVAFSGLVKFFSSIAPASDSYYEDPNRDFHGIPLSSINALAKEHNSTNNCTINEKGNLDFYYTSHRGHTNLCARDLYVENGKLKYDGLDYPGKMGAGKVTNFIEYVNERFSFK